MKKPTAVLVAGFPNSGTTITSMILGQQPEMFVAGELADFPDKRHFADYNVCSCGEKTADCPFWKGVLAEYRRAPKDDARLYQIIAAHAHRPFVIDVAHDVERVEQLAARQDLNLLIIHMVRHRHAVLNSRVRRMYRRGIIQTVGSTRINKIIKMGRRHQQFLSRMAGVMASMKERAIEVDYDAMCLDPHTHLGRVGAFLQLDLTDIATRLANGEPLERVPHLIRGNGKLRTEQRVVVRRHDEFKEELSMLDLWLYKTGVGLARLGVTR